MMRSASAHAFASSRRRPNRAGSGEKAAQKFFLDSAAESMLGVPLRDRNRPNRTIGRFGRVASERRHQSQDGASLAQRGATRALAIPARVAMGDARCASRICRSKHAAAPVPTIDDRRSRTMHAVRRPRSRSQSRWPEGQTRYPTRSTTRGAMLEQDAISRLALCSHLIDSGATLQDHA